MCLWSYHIVVLCKCKLKISFSVLPGVGYNVSSGPWRDTWVLYGYEPRKHPETYQWVWHILSDTTVRFSANLLQWRYQILDQRGYLRAKTSSNSRAKRKPIDVIDVRETGIKDATVFEWVHWIVSTLATIRHAEFSPSQVTVRLWITNGTVLLNLKDRTTTCCAIYWCLNFAASYKIQDFERRNVQYVHWATA